VRDLHWERDSYILKIVNRLATITLFKDDPVRREAAEKQPQFFVTINRFKSSGLRYTMA
jgi:hypothetical protein